MIGPGRRKSYAARVDILKRFYFDPRAGGKVRIFGFYTNKQTNSPPHFSLMRKYIEKLRDALTPEGLGSKTTS